MVEIINDLALDEHHICQSAFSIKCIVFASFLRLHFVINFLLSLWNTSS